MPNSRDRHPPEVEAQVVEMYGRGDRTAEIVAVTGVPRASVYAVLRRHQVEPNRIKRRSAIVPNPATVPAGQEELTLEERLSVVYQLAQVQQGDIGRYRQILEGVRTWIEGYFAGELTVADSEVLARHHAAVIDALEWD